MRCQQICSLLCRLQHAEKARQAAEERCNKMKQELASRLDTCRQQMSQLDSKWYFSAISSHQFSFFCFIFLHFYLFKKCLQCSSCRLGASVTVSHSNWDFLKADWGWCSYPPRFVTQSFVHCLHIRAGRRFKGGRWNTSSQCIFVETVVLLFFFLLPIHQFHCLFSVLSKYYYGVFFVCCCNISVVSFGRMLM